MTSKALQGYNPQFLDTAPAATPATGSPDLTNRLLQIMAGNLGGTLSSGEKLSALGALLKSVSRGSQTSPQQVMQQLQQQKMHEVQGRIQIAELQKQAARQAQTEKLRQDLINSEQDPRRKALLAMASAEDIGAIAREQFKPQTQSLDGIRAQLADLYGFGTPQYNQALKAYIERSQTITGPSGAVYVQQPVTLPALSTGAPAAANPNRDAALAELKRRGVI